MNFKTCEVGLFRLPGIVFNKDAVNEATLKELDEWAASEQGTGKRMTETLWSFKTESQRDWFILKWSDL